MSGKSINDYKKVFSELHNNIKKYVNIGESYEITELHSDFEIDIRLGCKKVYHNLIVKNYIWHMLRAIELKKNTLCLGDIMNNDTLLSLYNIICNLYLYDPKYVNLVFDIIKNKTDNENFIAFLDYFEEQYMKKCSPINWNYYNNTIHCTNNSCESYNCKIK